MTVARSWASCRSSAARRWASSPWSWATTRSRRSTRSRAATPTVRSCRSGRILGIIGIVFLALTIIWFLFLGGLAAISGGSNVTGDARARGGAHRPHQGPGAPPRASGAVVAAAAAARPPASLPSRGTRPGHYPLCPTYALVGIYCPGCGMLQRHPRPGAPRRGRGLRPQPAGRAGLPGTGPGCSRAGCSPGGAVSSCTGTRLHVAAGRAGRGVRGLHGGAQRARLDLALTGLTHLSHPA